MADDMRAQVIAQGIRVLRRRELEEYLYDPEVLRTFLQTECCEESVVETVLSKREALVNGQAGTEEHQGCIATGIRCDSPRYGVA